MTDLFSEHAPGAHASVSPAVWECINAFAAADSRLAWRWADRRELCRQLRERVYAPGRIQQGSASLCGPACVLYLLAARRPTEYVRFVIDLFEQGQASLGSLTIEPSRELLARPVPDGVNAVDWITMASIRNSENRILPYATCRDRLGGITLSHEIVAWLRALDCRSVIDRTRLVGHASWPVALEASTLNEGNYCVVLFVNTNMLHDELMTRRSLIPNHWAVLTSPLRLDGANVSFTAFTWGEGGYRVPGNGTLSRVDFLRNFYGFIAVRFQHP